MTDVTRLIRHTIRHSQQRQKFAEGGDVTADELIEKAREHLATQPERLRNYLPDVGEPAIGNGGEFSRGTRFGNRLFGTGTEPRHQLWPEKMVRSGVTLAGDILSGDQAVLPPGVRREDFTDIPPPSGPTEDSTWLGRKLNLAPQAAQPNDPFMERAQDMAGLAGGQTLLTGAREAPTIGALRKGASNAGATEAGVDVGAGLAGAPGGGEGLREAQLAALRRAGERKPLEGLPQGAQIVDNQPFVPGPVASAHDVAEAYMAGKDFGVPHPDRYHPIDVEHAKAIAQAFEEMQHAPKDPAVKAAYEALAQETLDQYRAIRAAGLEVTPVNAADYPYHGNPRAVVRDVADNNHMAFFKTNEGFGTNFHADPDHVLLRSSGEKVGDHDMLFNDLFRVVHDYFGHVKNGYGFRGAGEDNAWRAHAAMYSPQARRAMTTETRGQNSWLNYGPHGEHNRTANAADTIYADQKIGLLPDWVMSDRGTKLLSDSAGPGAPLAALEHAPKFYSGAERAVEAAPQSKMTGAQWIGTLANKGGVKAEEMQWTGLGDFLLAKKDAPVTKAEVQAHLGANKIELGETIKRGDGDVEALARKLAEEENGVGSWDRIGGGGQEHYWRDARRELGTKYHDYQFPGGENYQEKLLTLPPRRDAQGNITGHEIDGNNFASKHWEQPNVLVHRRSNEREVNGQKSLHLEEIQSDWHQTGRNRGYLTPDVVKAREESTALSGRINDAIGSAPEEIRRPVERMQWAVDNVPGFGGMISRFNQTSSYKAGLVPDAPFKKNWHELALKDAIREAAEKGIDRISWTPGETQATRYDLSKHLDRVQYHADKQRLVATDKHGSVKLDENVPPEKIADYIGKEAAERLLATKPKTFLPIHELDNAGLKIGGEGMKGFYDKIVPDYLNKVGKPHGVKVEKGSTEGGIDPNKTYEGPTYTREQLRSMAPDDRNSVTLERQYRAVMRDMKAGVSFKEAMQENASIALAEQWGGKLTNRYKNEPVHYMDIPQSLKDQALQKGFSLFEDSATAGAALAGLEKTSGVHYAPPKRKPTYYEHELNTAGNPIINKGVENPPNPRVQTVADPYRMMFPGIYGNPREIAATAAARVGPEDPAMKRLFGVTRGDLREMAQGRVGNEEPALKLAKNPRGSVSAANIQTPQNTQRLVDILDEAGKHEGLRTADAWYIQDPVYNRMKELGSNDPAAQYRHFNTMTAMASPGSDVLTEIQRGTAAHWLAKTGRFKDFERYAGVPEYMRNRMKFPADMRYIGGHPYHRTSQGDPMAKYLEHGELRSDAAKVPLYAHASGVPETGFQTSGPVGDAHFSRGVGLADTRRGPTDVGSSFSKPEYQTLQPWWQHDVAGKVGLESVPAQARLWTVLGPQTGVDSALGAPKLELLSQQIMEAARRLRISPEKARDLILSGKAGAGARGGSASAFAEGGAVGGNYRALDFVPPPVQGFSAPLPSVTVENRGRGRPVISGEIGNGELGIGGSYQRRDASPPEWSAMVNYRKKFEEGGEVTPVFDPTRLPKVAAATGPVFDPAKLAKKTEQPMSAMDVASGAVENLPSSAWQFVKDIVRPVVHPVETASGLASMFRGLGDKQSNMYRTELGLPAQPSDNEKAVDAMGQYLKDRYGGLENIKKTVAKDPIGALSDASMVLTAGGSGAARLPGIMGKTGEIVGNVGRVIDPLMAPVNAAKLGTNTVGELLTHTGGRPLQNAYRAGVEGGDAGEIFRGHMRGTADSVEPVEMAKRGLEGYRAARGSAYREGMGDITTIDRQMDPLDRVLDFGKIDQAVDATERFHRFGVMDINKPAAAVRADMLGEIAKWKALPPLEYHTLEGLDALKKSLGKTMMDTPPGTPARAAAGEIYNAVRKTIVEYDPKYAKVMKDYELASAQIKELERAMSLGEKASADTALRKLQSIMRNNVNTNYGRRLELGKLLEENGATHLMAALSGQSTNAWFPRGLGKLGAEAALLSGIGQTGHAAAGSLAGLGMAAAALPLMSPRIMGETAHAVGRTAGRALTNTGRVLGNVGLGGNRTAGNISYRLGRATNPDENNPYAP